MLKGRLSEMVETTEVELDSSLLVEEPSPLP